MLKLQVIGNLGKDANVNDVGTSKVINFNVAVTEKFKNNQGQTQEKTTWVEVAKWGDNTALAPYLKKGTQVYVEGTAEARSYPKNDGTTGVSLTLKASNIKLLGNRGSAENNNAPAAENNNTSSDNGPVDDLPF